ncbi:hypothetical protein [Blastococcus saxobsidens]|uniref:Lipoprotein n=1 Tax=Blastococcus saxobsidens (strain DD2) TaxID=1146883 RepID=H6RR53_BLASD|nr:hypothetical protein [Blastococcus saxobsidens]CCG04133.1 exported protein of unknown function [Blastococcus saxobsidens DD2]
MVKPRSQRLTGPGLAAVMALAGAGLSACGGMDDDNPLAPYAPAELPDIRGAEDIDDAYSGLLDPAFREDLDAYEDIEVTLLADVAEVISPRVFTVTSPDGSELEPVLVVATADAGDVDPQAGQSLLIAATPVGDFDAGTVSEDLGMSLDEQQLEEWEDEIYLVATILEPAQ